MRRTLLRNYDPRIGIDGQQVTSADRASVPLSSGMEDATLFVVNAGVVAGGPAPGLHGL